jgi:hypothetical protein
VEEQERARAAGEDARHLAAELADLHMPDRVDPSMKSMEPPVPHAMLDRPCRSAGVEQLSPRHDPVLDIGEPRDQEIQIPASERGEISRRRSWRELSPYSVVFSCHERHGEGVR